MNEKVMRKHYEATPKETLINILISSREQVEKLQNRNKERKQENERLQRQKEELQVNGLRQETLFKLETERLNNIINNAIKGIEDYYYGDKEYKEYDYTLAYKIYHILKGSDKE